MGDEETSHNVDRGKYDRGNSQSYSESAFTSEQSTNKRDATDRIRTTHQWSMQCWRDFGDDLKADKYSEHEDRDGGDDVHVG